MRKERIKKEGGVKKKRCVVNKMAVEDSKRKRKFSKEGRGERRGVTGQRTGEERGSRVVREERKRGTKSVCSNEYHREQKREKNATH